MFIENVENKNSLEKALKRLKRKIDKSGMMKDIRNRKEFVKKSVIRRSELQRAKYSEKNKTSNE